jgi:hypothetical protein
MGRSINSFTLFVKATLTEKSTSGQVVASQIQKKEIVAVKKAQKPQKGVKFFCDFVSSCG